MSSINSMDFNFGKDGTTSQTYINNECFRQIDYIIGWEDANTKRAPEPIANEKLTSLKPGRGNYLRTCLEHNFQSNTKYNRANFFPYCFSNDINVLSVSEGARWWNAVPRFNIVGNKIDDDANNKNTKLGFQKYICPKHINAEWPNDFWSLEKTESNSYWPIRPSNGDGGLLVYSPPKPYHARIRIKLTDFKWKKYNPDSGEYEVRNIFEDEKVPASESSDSCQNGEHVNLTKIRGYINLINPDATNATTNSTGVQTWPHAFNQIYYRVTDNPFGGDDDTPLITILNSECAGNSNDGSNPVYRSSRFFGDGISFEVPVLEKQQYLIFDIYTDICDRVEWQTASPTQWWQLIWSFESCLYRPISNSGNVPLFYQVKSPEISPKEISNSSDWPRKRFYYEWRITHGMNTKNLLITVFNNSTGVMQQVQPDISIEDESNIIIKIGAFFENEENLSIENVPNLSEGLYSAFIIASQTAN